VLLAIAFDDDPGRYWAVAGGSPCAAGEVAARCPAGNWPWCAGRSAGTPAGAAPLLIRPAANGTDLRNAAIDVLAMSKMNWNNAQLDERDPLTLRTAHRVGAILKHVPPDAQIATRYAYYM